jgi:diguanylate cyclase (GGDEF)-like protein
MSGSYSLPLVALSLVVAIVASYTALELAARVSQSQGKSAWAWLIGGAVSMGTGIWSTHFIGMLAFRLPVTVAYDAALTALSLAIAIAASGVALFTLRRPAPTLKNIAVAAILMGAGISAMHYTGMHAMRMSPAIEYRPSLLIVSIAVAMAAAFIAVRTAFRVRDGTFGSMLMAKLGGAATLALGIGGMHYIGMAAANFAPGSVSLVLMDADGGMKSAGMAMSVGVASIGVLAITLIVSALDAHIAARTARLADSLQTANRRLSDLALYDSLTGLPNRVLLDDRLQKAVSQAERSRNSFALMFVDLDRFKPVNDSFGHGVGDDLLKVVAQRLADCVRKADTVARTGGDEFVVVLDPIGDAEDAAMVARKILDELSRPFFVGGHEVNISASIGIGVYPKDGEDPGTLKANADAAMYEAKRSGRNEFRFFVPTMTTAALP